MIIQVPRIYSQIDLDDHVINSGLIEHVIATTEESDEFYTIVIKEDGVDSESNLKEMVFDIICSFDGSLVRTTIID